MKINQKEKRCNSLELLINHLEDINDNFKDKLEKLYLIDMYSFRQLTKLLNVNNRTIKKLLVFYNIPIRYGSDAVKSQWHNNSNRRRCQSLEMSKRMTGSKAKILKEDEINKRLMDSNLSIIKEYKPGNKRKFLVKCNHCDSVLLYGVDALVSPHCTSEVSNKKPRGEIEISNYLIHNNIDFTVEYSFSDLKDIRRLRFDFCVFNGNEKILIEYQGIQHYDKTSFFYSEQRVKTDFMKREYCSKKGLKLIEVPYYYLGRINEFLDYHLNL